MRRLRISSTAAFELDELNYYGFLNYGEQQATSYYRALQREIDSLPEYPLRHRERDEVRPPIRLMPFGAHHIFYDVTDEEVLVVRILHHSSDWKNIL